MKSRGRPGVEESKDGTERCGEKAVERKRWRNGEQNRTEQKEMRLLFDSAMPLLFLLVLPRP
jgi:hypothetical protein